MAAGALVPLRPRLDPAGDVGYELGVGTTRIDIVELLGRSIEFTASGTAQCVGCAMPFGDLAARGRFGGYCRRCWFALPQCDRCFRSPELCHFDRGTCRDEAFGARICFSPHVVYLAETSGAKVGITRAARLPERWLEQGAVAARVFATVESRRVAGEIEALLRQQIGDRTQWQAMLRRRDATLDLGSLAQQLAEQASDEIAALRVRFGATSIGLADTATASFTARYPLDLSMTSATLVTKALRLRAAGDRIAGRVLGAKARYLVLDSGVFNTGAHDGIELCLASADSAPVDRSPQQSSLF